MIARNIIQKTILDLQYTGSTDGFAMQRDLGNWCNEQLAPGLEEMLDEADTGATVKKIDRIELEINLADNKDWLSVLCKEIGEQLKQKLLTLSPEAGEEVREQTRGQSFFEVFIYFLQKGHLPWWSTIKDKHEFSESFIWMVKEGLTSTMKTVLQQQMRNATVQQRLMDQLSDEEYSVLISEFYTSQKGELLLLWKEAFELVAILPTEKRREALLRFKKILWRNAVNPEPKQALQQAAEEFALEILSSFTEMTRQIHFKKYQPGLSLIKEAINKVEKEKEEIARKKNNLKDIDKPKTDVESITNKEKEEEIKQEPQESIYISNAGLVIIAAFLPAFFNKLQLVNDDKILEEDIAVNLVSYLATNKEYQAEFELVLAKILCGIAPETPISTTVTFTEEQKKEANELLLSVIEYWSVVKDTSVEGVRESFLQREGKLVFQNEEWVLQVEQKPYDMLLQSLPWNISMIRLPWMTSLLKTEWIY